MELKWRLGLRFGNCLGLLIVLNGIEMLLDKVGIVVHNAFNRTKWN